MTDTVSKKRSEVMRSIKGKDTKPEILIRKLIFSMGYRYRIHRKNIPGKPDLAFISKKKFIFVNGCFCHNVNFLLIDLELSIRYINLSDRNFYSIVGRLLCIFLYESLRLSCFAIHASKFSSL